MDEYYQAVSLLPSWLARPLAQLPSETAARVQELRLRTGCGISVTLQGQQCALRTVPECPPALRTLRLTALQMEEIFYTLCSGSVHAHEAELAEGYLTTASGCRVGVAGQYVQRPGCPAALQRVTSLVLRVARARQVVLPDKLCQIFRQHFTGLLLAGEPGSGKTTLLRQIALLLAREQKLVAVIDERGELFPPETAPAPQLERIGGLPKAQAVQMALRTLAPQIIMLDELGGLEEVSALEQGFFSGVDFVASIHASSAEEALCRPQTAELLQHHMLRFLVVLTGRQAPGRLQEIREL